MQVYLNNEDPARVEAFADALTKAVAANEGKSFKAFMLFIGGSETPVIALAESRKISNVGMAMLNGVNDEAIGLYKINTAPEVKNTVILYRNRKVVSTFVNMDPVKDAKALNDAIAQVCQ